MNRTLLLFILGLILTKGKAQDSYHPFIEEEKVWICINYSTEPFNDHSSTEENYTIGKDTVVNSVSCKLLEHFCIYEEDKKVFWYCEREDKFYLMYDFGCQEGDVFDVVVPNKSALAELYLYHCHVEAISTIMGENGKTLQCYTLQIYTDNEPDPITNTWIEGVGSILSPIQCVGDPFPPGGSNYLMSCSVNKELLYYNTDSHWGTAIGNVEIVRDGKSERIINSNFFDLSGRRIVNPKRGLYIQGGKKKLKR